MNDDPNSGLDDRARRELTPRFGVEIGAAIVLWAIYVCRAVAGFDLFWLFHRGDPISAKVYLWIAIAYSVVVAMLVPSKRRNARILQSRGVQTKGTVVSIGYFRRQWTVKVRYLVDGKEYTTSRNLAKSPADKLNATVIYDSPQRSWIRSG